ncbi:MAG: ADP-ribosylglycohydrolase family protein, partial [Caldilineaceae bacterium]
VVREVETDTAYSARSHHSAVANFRGTLGDFLETYIPQAMESSLSVRDACDLWYSGAFMLETVPAALYILMRHGTDPEEAIVRAVNDTRDNDTVAAIVGAAMGALHGRHNLPASGVSNLLGRLGAADDGAVQELLRRAQERWWSPVTQP